MKKYLITDDLSEVNNLAMYHIVDMDGAWSESYQSFQECLDDADFPTKIIGVTNTPRYTGHITDFELGGIYAYALEENFVNLCDIIADDVDFDAQDEFVDDLMDELGSTSPDLASVRATYEQVWRRYHFEPVCEIVVTQEYLDSI